MAELELYGRPIGLTSQFRFCGNPLRCDVYLGCEFGCRYCFANARGGAKKVRWQYKIADWSCIEKKFKNTYESDKPTNDIEVEMMRHKVPLHVGGMSDPFQPKMEKEYRYTYKLIELSNKYQHPMTFSTKACHIDDEYWDILDPKLHAFQISLVGYDEDWIRKYEANTPTPQERIEFMKKLKSKGFWVSMRLQPLIDLEQAIKLFKAVDGIVDYITIEHLKIPCDNKFVMNLFKDFMGIMYKPMRSINYEVRTSIKMENIEKLKQYAHCPVGVGDNDLHFMSDSSCCCGIDTIGGAFSNYMKYNCTYFETNPNVDKETLYIPQGNVGGSINGDQRIKGWKYKDYVDDYYQKQRKENMKEQTVLF